MSPFDYYDREKLSSSDNDDEQNDDFKMEEIDNDNGNDNDFDKYFEDYENLKFQSSSKSLNYPNLRPIDSDEEHETEEYEYDFGYRNRRIPRNPKSGIYEYGIGYGSPPEEEHYRAGYDEYSRMNYNNRYRSKYGNYYSFGGYNKRERDNESDNDNQLNNENKGYGFNFRNNAAVRPSYYANRYSGISGYSESSLSGPSTPEPIRGNLSKEEGGRIGLRNLGNTCYLNSTLQCLTATIELSYRLAEDLENGILPNGPNGNNKTFLTSMARLFHEMWESEGKLSSISRSVAPTQFKSVLGHVDSRFSGYRQEDSQEALAIILDRLHDELKTIDDDDEGGGGDNYSDTEADGWIKYCKKENSIVRELFHGQLKSTLECCKCSFKSETYEPFCFLNLPIPVHEPIKTIYKREHENENKVLYDKASNDAHPISGKFNILCFNDKIFNSDSSYLIMNRSFKNMNEFRMFFRGAGVWIIEIDGNRVIGVKTKLPNISDLKQHCFIAVKAEIMYKNHLVTFVAARSGEVVGFPILIRTKMNETLAPALFIENFLKSTIRSIYVHRFPERLKSFDSTVSLMQSSANEYFKVEYIKNDPPDLYHVRVVILNDKSDFNEMIFFKEIDDPTDLFEELCINLVTEDFEEDEDEMVSSHNDNNYYNPYSNNHQYSSNLYPHTNPYTTNAYTTSTYITHNHSIDPVSLKDCFDKLFSIETFNEWKCEKCGIPVDAEKRMELWRLPEILILHLKRFSYAGGGAKISKAVDFPLELEMPNDSVYDLFGISQHFGSLNFGHYTAILKHQPTGKWFLADDGSITVYENESEWYNEKLKESAYVLFYRRRAK